MSKRRKTHEAPAVLPEGIREVIMTVSGTKVVVRVNDLDGITRIDRLAEPEPEVVEHSFPTCETCGEQHLSIGGENPSCPRTGWQNVNGFPMYPTGARVLQEQVEEASIFNRATSANLNQLARLIGHKD